MAAPRVSIIIPTYNRAQLLDRAVSSAVEQCEPGDEILIIDDGSTDSTPELTEQYKPPIRTIRAAHAGAGAARNRGIREAGNPLIGFLDSDDAWVPGKLGIQRTLMQARPDILFTFTNLAIRTPAGKEHRFALDTWHKDPRGWDEILGPGQAFGTIAALPPDRSDFFVYIGDLYAAELAANYISTITLMVRRDAGSSLRFAEDLPTYEDWECFGRLARAGLCAYLDCETAWLLGHSGPRLTEADGLICAEARERIIERIWGSDQDFLEKHRDQYESVLAEQQLIQVKGLIARGRTAEARMVLKKCRQCPLFYRMLAALPGWLISPLLRVNRVLRRVRT